MKKGFFLFTLLILFTKCLSQCPPNCIDTSCINFQCKNCSIGFGAVNGKCVACPQGCSECDSDYKCTKCYNSKVQIVNNTCMVCSLNCSTCSIKPNNCTTCQQNYVLDFQNKCVVSSECPIQNCRRCVKNKCILCYDQYFLWKNVCHSCKYPSKKCYFDMTLWYREMVNYLSKLNTVNFLQGYYQNEQFENMLQVTILLALKQIFYGKITSDQLSELQQFLIKIGFLYTITDPKSNKTSLYLNASKQLNLQQKEDLIVLSQNFTYSQSIQQKKTLLPYLWLNLVQYTAQQCIDGFGYDYTDRICKRCYIQQGVKTCTKTLNTGCFDGYYLLNGLCKKCSPKCKTCVNSSNICTSCQSPLTVSQVNTCVACDRQCLSCLSTNTSRCTRCFSQTFSIFPSSYSSDVLGQCYRCDNEACLFCNETNIKQCFQCKEEYALTAFQNGQADCIKCPQYCKSCGFLKNKQIFCFECWTGFTVSPFNNSCLLCKQKSCEACSPFNTSICFSCSGGSTYSRFDYCIPCPFDCQHCSMNGICLLTRKGYTNSIYFNQLTSCGFKCDVCTTSLSLKICYICSVGYYNSTAGCIPCTKNCQECTSLYTCTKCRLGSILINGVCILCNNSCGLCSENNISSCTMCFLESALNPITHDCSAKCSQNCQVCIISNQQQTVCVLCFHGYTLTANFTCMQCIQGCSGKCNPKNVTECLYCNERFSSQNNTCYNCPQNCLTCTGQKLTCTKCYPGYQYNNTLLKCVKKCLYPCLQCSQKQCFQCDQGHFLKNGICFPDIDACNRINNTCKSCPIGTFGTIGSSSKKGNCKLCQVGCLKCQNRKMCHDCVDGLYRKFGVCAICQAPCLTCLSLNFCKSCVDGYRLGRSGKCVECPTNCKTCELYGYRCDTCSEGYQFRGDICFGKNGVNFDFRFLVDFDGFLRNSSLQVFHRDLANILNIYIDRIIIKQLKEGSTKISGSISAQDNKQAEKFQSILASIFSYKNNFSNLQIGSYLFTAYYDENGKPKPEQNNLNVGLIVGCTIGGVVFVAILIVAAVYIHKQKNKKIMQTDVKQQFQSANNIQSNENIHQQLSNSPYQIQSKENTVSQQKAQSTKIQTLQEIIEIPGEKYEQNF